MTVLERSAAPGSVKLLVAHSRDASLIGTLIELDPARPVVTIGRARGATFVLPTPDISRLHATITWTDGRWILRDEGSTHGVRRDGELVQQVELASGDRLVLGETVLVVDHRPIEETVHAPTTVDGLTGLANKRHFLDELRVALQAARPLSVVRLDVDDLKSFNDAHGHIEGDALLVELARRVRAAAPPGALVARVGGDDFAILLVGAQLLEARRVAAHIRARVLAASYRAGAERIRPQLSAGVASAHGSRDGLLDAAEHDLRARRRPRCGMDETHEWALGGRLAPNTERTLYVGAGARGGVFALSDGDGSHASGWLGARLAVRVLLERFAAPLDDACLLGTADVIPDEWGWPAAMRSYASGEQLYEALRAELGDLAALPPDVPSVLVALDRALVSQTMRDAEIGLLVGCTAARIVERTVVGAHVGQGRARLLRAGADHFDDLVVPHFLHLVAHRSTRYAGVDLAALPPHARVLVSGLGQLASAGVGVDVFEAELRPGDVLLLCSNDEIGLADGELIAILSRNEPVVARARAVERRLGELAAEGAARPSPCAFALIRSR